MGIEIERKFLVSHTRWLPAPSRGKSIRQGYLSVDPGRTVRVRLVGDAGWITVKGPSNGATRAEYEYAIPAADAAHMLDTLALKPLVEKVRHLIDHDGNTWEVDVFTGANAGLVVAELELQDEHQPFTRPPWLGPEVTEDHRYSNSSLVHRPFQTWTHKAPT